MIRLPNVDLAAEIAAQLRRYQADVDEEASYAERVATAKRLFAQRNTKSNPVFAAVKVALDAMCSGARRCAYCEDSMADEVEHVRPKDLYPEVVFSWANYVYACGPCNGPKGNHFAVLITDSAEPVEVARKPKDLVRPPLEGDAALIDPRVEDATALMLLDLRDTFRFSPIARKGTREHARATYTISTLHLNDRDSLTEARKQAYIDYVNFVRRYQYDRDHKASSASLDWLVAMLKRRQHPTVWREMQRQHDKLPELRGLFAEVPEAVHW